MIEHKNTPAYTEREAKDYQLETAYQIRIENLESRLAERDAEVAKLKEELAFLNATNATASPILTNKTGGDGDE